MLVTDGYWNDSSAPAGVGNVDNTAATLPNPNGASYTYTPVANYNGAVPVISYTVTDGTDNPSDFQTMGAPTYFILKFNLGF